MPKITIAGKTYRYPSTVSVEDATKDAFALYTQETASAPPTLPPGEPEPTKPQVDAAKARSMGREIVSMGGAGLAGEMTLATPLAPMAPVVSGITYQGINRLLGGDPGLVDTLGAVVSPAGSMATRAGVSAGRSALIQGATDVAAQQIPESLGLATPTSLLNKAAVFGTSALGQYGGELFNTSPYARNVPLEEAAGRLNLPRTIGLEQSIDLLPMARGGDIVGAQTNIRKAVEEVTGGLNKALPAGPYDAQKSADTARKVMGLLKQSDRQWTDAELNVIDKTIQTLAPSDAAKVADAVRTTVANAPMGARISDPDVRNLLGSLGFDPNVTPRKLGEWVQKVIDTQVTRDMDAAAKAYAPVFKDLGSMPDPVTVDLSSIPQNFRAELSHAEKFFRPATGIADEVGGPVQKTIGELATMLRDTNMLLRSTARTPANKPKRAALWELRQLLDKAGDDFVKANPNSPAAAKWSEYAQARQQYRGAAEQAKLADELPDDVTELGLGIAAGRSESKPNPTLDVVDRFFGAGTLEEPGRQAGTFAKVEPSMGIDQITTSRLKEIKSVPGTTPKMADEIDRMITRIEQKTAPAPKDAPELINTLLPLGPDDLNQTTKRRVAASSEMTQRVWGAIAQMPPDQADQMRGLLKSSLIDRARKPDGTFDPQRFAAAIEANREVVPANELAQLESVGQVLTTNVNAMGRPEQLSAAIKAVEGSSGAVDFASKFAKEWRGDPQTAKFLMDSIQANDPKLANQFRDSVMEALATGKSQDQFGRLLDFSENMKLAHSPAMEAVLGPKNWQVAKDVETVVDNMRPLLGSFEAQNAGRQVLAEGSQLRQFTSLANYVKMIGMGTVGTVAGFTAGVPAAIVPAMMVVAAYPRIMSEVILNPNNKLRSIFSTAAKSMTQGGRAAAVTGEREIGRNYHQPTGAPKK